MNNKCKKDHILSEKVLSPLFEVEDFLCKYNKFSDILHIIKISKKQSKHHNF